MCKAVLIAVMVLGATSLASAQTEGRRVLELGEEVVEGRIEKPEAFYILQPTNLNYEQSELEESFIPELLRTVQEEPF